MVTADQSEVVAFLSSPAAHGGHRVERIETHASIVFLAGPHAWKIKRAVLYDYLDYSTLERRKAMCDAEVRLNVRTAPQLYLGVEPITREPDRSLAIGGAGVPVEWAVKMARFEDRDLFERLAGSGRLELDLMRPLASSIARFHASAERTPDHGGVAGMRWVVDGNESGLAEQGTETLDPHACAALIRATREQLHRHGVLLESRRACGLVRRCHGDLHLRNLVLLDGRPALFDAVEFNDDISCIDVQYDLAFLIMDLWHRRMPAHANAVWNGYLSATDDAGALPLLPLFLSCRAAVRAKTSATAAKLQSDATRGAPLAGLAQKYLDMARRLLEPVQPCLVAVGGLSGSGKSTLARAVAPILGAVPGALVIRSDEVRKRLCGVDPLQRLGPEGYTVGMSRRVYESMAERADAVLRSGHAAIVDAVYADPVSRAAIEQIAAGSRVPFVGLWLDAPEPVLIARADRRRHDPSDADASVIRRQVDAGAGGIEWSRIDAAPSPHEVERSAIAILRDRLPALLRPA